MVDNCKYLGLGHIISSVNDDNQNIARQMSLLYATANMLTRKFSNCSRDARLCSFRAYCTECYGTELWKCFHTYVVLNVLKQPT